MKNKPKITYWREPIDRNAVACFACRNWDVPSNAVFLLFTRKEIFGTREAAPTRNWRGELTEKLNWRERTLFNYAGRAFRYFLTAEIDPDTGRVLESTRTWPVEHLR